VVSLPVQAIPPAVQHDDKRIDFDRGLIPAEPNAGEILVCMVPVAKLALSDFLVQTTRRGCVKKISSGMSQSILANHYIGTGVKLPADQTFDLILCGKDDRLVLVSHMGYLLGLEVKRLPFSIEETMRLTSGDFVEAALVIPPDSSILVVTQIGKLIHRTEEALEMSTGGKSRGQPVFSAARREQGVRVISAVAVRDGDGGAALHRDGRITVHSIQDLFFSGTIQTEGGLLAFTRFSNA
jgi:DNA gyrase/topoisomerase IV subunit A